MPARRLFLFALLPLNACLLPTDVPNTIDRSYLRGSAVGLFMDIDQEDLSSDGPYLGGEVMAGTLLHVNTDFQADSIEFAFQVLSLNPGGDIEGTYYRYLGGYRRWFRLDERVRPSMGVGLTWSDVRLRGTGHRYDPHGIGVYADLSLDTMLDARWGIGLNSRYYLSYLDTTEGSDELVSAAEIGVHVLFRF